MKEKRPRDYEDAAKILDEAIFSFEVIVPYIKYFTRLAITFSSSNDFKYDVTEKTIKNLIDSNKRLVDKLVKMAEVVKENFELLDANNT
jgi:hypothetical protein